MYSYLDGFGGLEKYAEAASQLGFSHLGISEHAHIDSAIKFQKACEKYKITPIFGMEAYMVPDISLCEKGEQRSHVLLMVKNETGWQNLLKLITTSNLEGFYYRPRISPDLLMEYREGLIISTACSASFLAFPWGEELLQKLIEQDKEDLYLEVMNHNFQIQTDINILCSEYSKKYNLPLLSTNDCHFVRKEDSINHEVLLCVQTKKKWKNPDRWSFPDKESYYLKTREEMEEGFRRQGILTSRQYRTALSNTMLITEKCSDFTKIPEKEISLPLPPSVEWNDEVVYLKQLCEDGMAKLNKITDKIYRQRLDEELELIIKQKFVRYFLIVWELIDWCKKNNILTGPGRGSAAGSLVCYLLGITKVDPIKYKLIFSRFINPDRVSLPDIDLDFADNKIDLVIMHLEELYGEHNVSPISTVTIMGGKQALRDVARVFDISYKDVDRGSSAIISRLKGDEIYGETIKEALEMFEDGKWFARKYPEVAKIAMDMEGTVRQKSVHAAALVISEENLREGGRCAFSLDRDKNPIINWDKDDIEHVGLMKLDALKLSMLSVMAETKDLIKENHGIDLDLESIPFDDEECYKQFSKGNNVGCFQLGSFGLRKYCKQVGVDDFNTLVDINALYRPGPLNSGISESYIQRKKGIDEVQELHPIYDEITKDTYGLLIYQEQVMFVAHKLAGIDWGVTDQIRKDIAKSKGKDALRKYERKFVRGCLKQKTLNEDQALMLWNDIVEYGKYSFNLSHSVSYSVLTYWGMWLKLNYPTEFICALLTYGATGTDKQAKKTEFVQEAFRLGIDVRPPKVGISDAYKWVIVDDILYAPFIEIKGVGEKNAEKFLKLQSKGFYESSKEKEPVTKRFLNILDEIDAYNNIGLSDEEADRISELMGLSFVKDSLYKYKNFIDFLESGGIKIGKAKDLNAHGEDNSIRYYFGKIEELKLSTFKGEEGKKASASVLFRDDTGDFKFNFDRTFYKNNTEAIEHSEDSYVLIKVNIGKRSITCNYMWFAEDLMQGKFDGLDLHFLKRSRYRNTDLLECTECQLREECTAPVLPSSGRYNMMISMEAPGCFLSETPIFYDDVVEPIQNYKTLDKKVLNNLEYDVNNMLIYKFKVNKFPEYRATYNHKIFIVKRERTANKSKIPKNCSEPYWATLNEIYKDFKNGDQIFTLVPKSIETKNKSESYIDVEKFKTYSKRWVDHKLPNKMLLSSELSFLFGCYMGDGSANFNAGSVNIHISKGYKEQYLSEIINGFKLFNLEPTVKIHKDKKIDVSIYSRSLCELFLDLFGKNCYEKRIPKLFFNSGKDCVSNFLFGWYVTDGSHRSNKRKAQRITTVSKWAAWDAVNIALKYNVLLGLSSFYSGRTNEVHCYDINFDSLSREKLNWNIHVNKIKSPNYGEDDKYFYLKINKMEYEEYSGKVYDKTTKSHSYKIPFIVHNSEEDKQREGLVGRSGQELWKELDKYNFTRRNFFVSNVVKCYPSISKTPTRKHITACSKWIGDEIEKVNPFVILAGGNTGIKFFTEEDSGIMGRNGTIEWNDKYKTFVAWIIHPASVLYNPENRSLFEEGIKNFCDFIKNVS